MAYAITPIRYKKYLQSMACGWPTGLFSGCIFLWFGQNIKGNSYPSGQVHIVEPLW